MKLLLTVALSAVAFWQTVVAELSADGDYLRRLQSGTYVARPQFDGEWNKLEHWKGCSTSKPCEQCKGTCKAHNECRGPLLCSIVLEGDINLNGGQTSKGTGYLSTAGCWGTQQADTGYCFEADPGGDYYLQTPKPTPSPTKPPSPTPAPTKPQPTKAPVPTPKTMELLPCGSAASCAAQGLSYPGQCSECPRCKGPDIPGGWGCVTDADCQADQGDICAIRNVSSTVLRASDGTNNYGNGGDGGVSWCWGTYAENESRKALKKKNVCARTKTPSPTKVPTTKAPVKPTRSPTKWPTKRPTTPKPTVSPQPSFIPRAPTNDGGTLIVDPGCEEGGECSVCTGNCTKDSDCLGALSCWTWEMRQQQRTAAPGCTTPPDGVDYVGYCFDPYYNATFAEREQPPPPDPSKFYFNHSAVTDSDYCPACTSYSGDALIPFSGTTAIGEGTTSYNDTTYIYVLDTSGSTVAQGVEDGEGQWGVCGDQNSKVLYDILDCEILAITEANNAAITSGGVNLVALVEFGSEAQQLHGLIPPWKKTSLAQRDEDIVETLRSLDGVGFTNFEAGVREACLLATDPLNTNENTVVIFVSDGAPNRGVDVTPIIKNSCNNAVFRTFAITDEAYCDRIDTAQQRTNYGMTGPALWTPNTLDEIAMASGGSCEKIVNITSLPEKLSSLVETKLLSVTVEVDGVVIPPTDPKLTLDFAGAVPPFTGPKRTAYSGTLQFDEPGVYEMCLISTGEIGGKLEKLKECQTIVIYGVEIKGGGTTLTAGVDTKAELEVSLTVGNSTLPTCTCDEPVYCVVTGSHEIPEKKYDTVDGKVTVSIPDDGSSGEDTIVCCHKDADSDDDTDKDCDTTTITWEGAPSAAPSVSPSGLPTKPPTPGPTEPPTKAPTDSPSSTPSASPSESPSDGPSSKPSFLASDVPSGSPSKVPTPGPTPPPTASPTEVPTAAPSDAPSVMASDVPSGSPSRKPSPGPTFPPTANPTTSPSSEPSGSPSMMDSDVPSGSPSRKPSPGPTFPPTANPTTSPSGEPSGSPSMMDSDVPSGSPSRKPSPGPTFPPTANPTTSPSGEPSGSPSMMDSDVPSRSPSQKPSPGPTFPPTANPTTSPSGEPSGSPSLMESDVPSRSPSLKPSPGPTFPPTANPTSSPSSEPSSVPSKVPTPGPSAAPIALAPPPPPTAEPTTAEPTKSPIAPTDLVDLTCNHDAFDYEADTCVDDPQPKCRPKRFPVHCKSSESFLDLIQTRRGFYESSPDAVSEAGYWYPQIATKVGAKLFAEEQRVKTAQLYYCSDDVATGLDDFIPPRGVTGFVVKAIGLHSDQGVYVLPTGFGGEELMSGDTTTGTSKDDIKAKLISAGAKEFIIEEYMGYSDGTIADEYKFHMFNGTVGSIIYTANRGTSCECFAEMDADWVRVDTTGCFRPGLSLSVADGQCARIDYQRGYTVPMKGQDLCSNAPRPPNDSLAKMTEIATKLSETIGVYMRIDMFLDEDGEVVIQEFTPSHTNGRVHCTAVLDETNGCLDACYLGKLWSGTGGSALHGGAATPVPAAFADGTKANDLMSMCARLLE